VLALTLEQAKTIAILIVVALVAIAIGAAWLMKTVAQKVALVAIIGLLAVLVWSQRTSLDECADKVREGGVRVDTTCSFFGRDINISANRPS
jgi:membrane protein implicated in regulation of membrane protease activity